MPRSHSRAAIDRLENTKPIVSPISEVVWQQPTVTSVETSKLVNTHNDPTNKSNQTIHMLKSQERVDVESQTLPVKGISPQK